MLTYEDRIRLASIYIQGGQDDRAVPVLEDAAAREPGRPQAHSLLGEIRYRQGNSTAAIRHFEESLKAGGDDPVVLNNLAWVELNADLPGDAERHITRALALEPVPRYPYLDTKARILLALGRRDEARRTATTALAQVPAHDQAMKTQLEELVTKLRGSSGEGEDF